ncbi:hypothetical protein CDIK_4362 [Cucumispora dikerogammari]|nr:hypothetical protein CDIK_4362 [Cucumispora dikerogammari]
MFLSTYILVCEQILCPKSNIKDMDNIEAKFNKLLPNTYQHVFFDYDISPFYGLLRGFFSLLDDSGKPRKDIDRFFEKNVIVIGEDEFLYENITYDSIQYNVFYIWRNTFEKEYSDFSDMIFAIIAFELKIFKIYLVLNNLPLYREECENFKYDIVKNYFNSLDFTTVPNPIKQPILREKCESILKNWANNHIYIFDSAFELQKSKNEKTHKNDPNID